MVNISKGELFILRKPFIPNIWHTYCLKLFKRFKLCAGGTEEVPCSNHGLDQAEQNDFAPLIHNQLQPNSQRV